MNRPEKDEDYELMVHNAYVSDLEKYCDELELDKGYVQMHADSFLDSLKKQEKEIEKLNKALDKAIDIIVFYQKGKNYADKENKMKEWKEAILQWVTK